MKLQGIDVSKYQGEINWHKVKASGIKFAMIRLGWAGWEGEISVDAKFKQYIESAIAAGIDVGVYVFSYCKTPEAAWLAAHDTLHLIKPYKLSYPVAFDMETEAETPYQNYTKAQNSEIANAFLTIIAGAKYYAMLYSYKSFLENNLDMAALKYHDVWVAQISEICTYKGAYGMWQYSWKGKIDGISVDCDLNYAYKDYASIIKQAGLNGWAIEATVPPAIAPDEPPTMTAKEIETMKRRNEFLENQIQQIRDLVFEEMA